MRIAACSALVIALGLAACDTAPTPTAGPTTAAPAAVPAVYQARVDSGPQGQPVDIPAVNPAYLVPRNQRQMVAYNGSESPGTIVVDPYARFLYYVLEDGQAMRYGIAVGKAGKGFAGSGSIQRKATWPSWTPTANMVSENPDLYGPVKNGLPGGLDNPLGSRALYLYKGGRDTLYRIHGTMDPSSIGRATSAGCIRLFNQDIMDLYEQIKPGTPVTVRSEAESRRLEGNLVETPNGYLTSSAPPAAAMPTATTTTVVAADAAPMTLTAPVVSPVESAVPMR